MEYTAFAADWLGPLRDIPDVFFGLVALFGIPILLIIYSVRHGAKRHKTLAALMPTLGFRSIAEALPSDHSTALVELVPDLLFHPDHFQLEEGADDGWGDLSSRVPVAWFGQLGHYAVTVMEVTVDRRAYVADLQATSQHIEHQLNQTVLRHDPRGEERPPELLVKEHVLFKSLVKGARTIGDSTRIGGHYFVYSKAPQAELERWITPRLRPVLSRHRLWRIAVHEGVFYLTRGMDFERPDQIQSFLEEGESLLVALLASE